MNTQIIIGWSDKSGLAAATILAGLDSTEAARTEIMNQASRYHIFPSGIQRVARANIEIVQTETFINGEVTAHLKARKESDETLKLERKQKAESLTAAQKLLRQLAEMEREAARERNALIAARAQQETLLRNLLATPEKVQAKNHKSEITKAQGIIETLQPRINAAAVKFQAIQNAHELAKAGKLTALPKAAAEKAAAEKAAADDALSAANDQKQPENPEQIQA